MKNFAKKLYNLFSSPIFFRIIVIFFILEASWIAVSAAYPQAFDENFHFGIIQIYSHYWLPFLSSQPPHANTYGAVARDPSYLYHYLMSFPYRLIEIFVLGQLKQIIILRFINIVLLTIGLFLFHKILRRVGISDAMANISVLIFALIPIAPQLAATINYDNLLIPLVAWVILITFDVVDQLRKRKPSAKSILFLISLCLLTSLVKYAFLPIFLAIVVFLGVTAFKIYRTKLSRFLADIWKTWKKESVIIKVGLLTLLVVASGMFAQRDIVNLVKYHSIEPNCSMVLSVADCKAYSPWNYNYEQHSNFEKNLQTGKAKLQGPFYFTVEWFYWMWYRLFFAVSGPSTFVNYPPLPLPSAAAIVLGVLSIVLFIKYWRTIFKDNVYLVLLFFISVLYIFTLFAQGYSTYRYTDILENMNGRYLLPVIFLLAAVFGRALSIGLHKSLTTKSLLAFAILLLFLQGGGILTFIARSDDSWDVHNHTIKKVNDVARKITNPIIVNGKKQYSTSYWFFN